MQEHFFEQLLIILCASLAAAVVCRRLRFPSIIAYLLAGTVIGPNLMGWIGQPGDFAFLAEFGVVFLLFSLGLEFSLAKLIALRSSVFGLGGIQVVFCSLVYGCAVWLWGVSIPAAIVIAGALTLSSTAIVTKELGLLRQVHSRHGQLSIGVLLFQDLAAVLFLILVPVLAGNDASGLGQALGWALAKGVLLVIGLLSLGRWVLPHFYKEVARARSEEIFALSTLMIVMLAAWVTHSLHLSMALGSFVIGMMLGESQFRHQINSDIRAFKDILLSLFFVTVGMSIQLQLLLEYWPRILLFTLALVLTKILLISLLVRLMGDNKTTALQTGLNLAQAGEFGLALLALGVMHGLLPRDQASFIIIVSIFSMALSPLLIHHSGKLSGLIWRLAGGTDQSTDTEFQLNLPEQGHVIIGGFGRVGKTLARLLENNGIDYIAIEQNNDVVSRERRADHNVTYGDCSTLDILRGCHLENAKMAVLTFSSMEVAKSTIEHIRSAGISVPIIVRLSEEGDFSELVSLGADCVIPEMLETSLAIGIQVMTLLNINKGDIEEQIDCERRKQLEP